MAEQLRSELQVMLGHGSVASTARLNNFEVLLRPMYLATSNRADGALEHAAASYTLHVSSCSNMAGM